MIVFKDLFGKYNLDFIKGVILFYFFFKVFILMIFSGKIL